MAESTRVIRRRIRGIKSIEQITKAMEMVAAVRFARMRTTTENVRPYVKKLQEVMARLRQSTTSIEHPLFKPREVQKIWGILITGDRGLCGTYNINMMTEAERFVEARSPEEIEWIIIGKKGYDAFNRKGYPMKNYFPIGSGELSTPDMRNLIHGLISGYEAGEVDEVHLLFTQFISVLTHRPTQEKVLPLEGLGEKEEDEAQIDFIFEPSAGEIIISLAPMFIETQISHAIIESFTSEQAARMVTMRNATDNAEEIIRDLILRFNKARQASITRELIDIVSGAEALRAT
ncbi:MAG: ATP synthase F1 subunit gamma [Thermodesulfobacteriota bacterium]